MPTCSFRDEEEINDKMFITKKTENKTADETFSEAVIIKSRTSGVHATRILIQISLSEDEMGFLS